MSRIFQSRAAFGALAAGLVCAVAIPVFAAAQGGSRKGVTGRRSGIRLISGPRGPRGPRGFRGVTGGHGAPGTAGTDGVSGKDGTPGKDGATGPQGSTGPTGASGATGTTGSTGSRGETGATGPTGPAPTTLWAVVDESGNLVRHGSGTVSASEVATGEYEVKFEQNVNECAYTATIASSGDGEAPAGEIAVATRELLHVEQPKSVLVHTYSSTGTAEEKPFHIVVSC